MEIKQKTYTAEQLLQLLREFFDDSTEDHLKLFNSKVIHTDANSKTTFNIAIEIWQ